MHHCVAAAFYEEAKKYEGETSWLYFDTHHPPLATTGIGNMIDAGSKLTKYGRDLPWRFSDGTPATRAQIGHEYSRLKALGWSKRGGYAYKAEADLFLEPSQLAVMASEKLNDMAKTLTAQFRRSWRDWPADAQLALLNMAWNMGPNFLAGWPNLFSSLKQLDFVAASKNCEIGGVKTRRNTADKRLFLNAAKVRFAGLDVARLWNEEVPQHPLPGRRTLVKMAAAKAAWAPEHPTSVGTNAWYVQRMLTLTGHYVGPLDGKFGHDSQRAFKEFCTVNGQLSELNVPALTTLSVKSGLGMAVVP